MYSVLIIDSDEKSADFLEKTVRWKSLRCKVIGRVENALEVGMKIRKLQPDIIITEILMPSFNGLEMIERLNKQKCKSNYIITTSWEKFEYAQKAIQLGVSGYLLKPIKTDEMEMCISKILSETCSDISLIKGYEVKDEKELILDKIQEQYMEYSLVIRVALNYIDRHLYSELSLTVLCDEVSLSIAYFSRLFKKEVGVGFSDYVTMVKMNRARKLLCNPHSKIYEVAEMLGYRDYTYFFQVFKKQFGYSPSEIKKNVINKNSDNI